MALVALGPLLATAGAWWGLSDQGERQVITFQGVRDDPSLGVSATALAVDPELGELTMRIVFAPSRALIDDDRLSDDVTILINDQSGRQVRTFSSGSVMDSLTIVVDLAGSSSRYPFDTYTGELRIGATIGSGSASEPLPIDVEVIAALPEFAMHADSRLEGNSARFAFDLDRRWAAITWVLMFMVISWAIALSCAGVTWWIVVYNASAPVWIYALFAAVLFALPTLRAGLPGDPRYGVLVDWAAFYWAITIVAFCLVAALTIWNVSMRESFRAALDDAEPEDLEDSPGTGE